MANPSIGESECTSKTGTKNYADKRCLWAKPKYLPIQLLAKTLMNAITIVGLIAATFTTIALLPQLVKVWKTKSTRDISTGMFLLYSSGVFLWFIYGTYINNLPIILANSIAFIQAIAILVFKAKYK